MKSIYGLFLVFWILAGCVGQPSQTETPASPGRGVARLSLDGDSVDIHYGRPALKGRDMLSRAQPGMVWRLGQNEATTLETTATLDFGGTLVPAGSYTLFAQLKSPEEWFLLVNSATGLWGAGDYDPTKNVAVIPLLPERHEESVETLTIRLDPKWPGGGRLGILWGNLRLWTSFLGR